MRVSVIIPVFNQAAYIGQAIESALAQTYRPQQIVVVDDGSTDETPAVCARYGSRIEYVRQDNAGPSAARNTGMGQARGDAVVFLDGDDLLCPQWIEQAVNAHARAQVEGQRVGVVYGDYLLFDDAGEYQRMVRIKRVELPGLLRDPLLIPSGTFVTGACLADVGSFRHDLPTCEDWDYWLRVVLRGYRCVRVPACGSKHREHSGSLSKQEIPATEGRVKFLQLWHESDELTPGQRAAIGEELARTLLRLRRAAYFLKQTQASKEYLRRALAVHPQAATDLWFFVYGAVYAAPFFRARIGARQVRQAVEAMRRDVIDYLATAGRLDDRALRRLNASAAFAVAVNEGLARRYASAGRSLLAVLVADPRLLWDALCRSSAHTAELLRARGSL